jgi:hypothetical protein
MPVVFYSPLRIRSSDTHFCYKLNKPQGCSAAGRIYKLKKIHSPRRDSNPRPSGLSHSASMLLRSLIYFITLIILTFCHLFLTYNSRILWLGTRGSRRLTTLQASTACYRNSFNFTEIYLSVRFKKNTQMNTFTITVDPSYYLISIQN